MLNSQRLPLDGGVNFRELGGYTMADGRQIRAGKLFRSGAMDGLTQADCEQLQLLDIKSICDFREPYEREKMPTPNNILAADGKHFYWDYGQLLDIVALAEECNAAADPASLVREMMVSFYQQLPSLFAPYYAQVFERLKSGDNLLFHCSAGKDRTGMMAMLLLTALGADEQVITADYLATNQAPEMRAMISKQAQAAGEGERIAGGVHFPTVAFEAFMVADMRYLNAGLAQINSSYGSVNNYLQTELNMDKQACNQLQAQYLI